MTPQQPPWFKTLSKSYKDNHNPKDTTYLPMCNIKRSGDLSLHCLRFKGFLEQDGQLFKFLLAMNDNRLMGDIKTNPQAKINWMMPKTKEYYNFVGKFYIASAPIQVTRFPPPKISDEDNSEFWEKERLKLWDELDPKTRAEFTWPSKGEMPKAEDIAFSCQSLTKTSNVVHDIARDNFCLLVYKVTQVEYFNYNTFPQQRLVYQFDPKSHSWSTVAANP